MTDRLPEPSDFGLTSEDIAMIRKREATALSNEPPGVSFLATLCAPFVDKGCLVELIGYILVSPFLILYPIFMIL